MEKDKLTKRLEIVYLKLDQLALLESNPRKEIDPDSKEKLKILIREHGFQNPLQVFKEKTGQYSILCGNHRFVAGCELNIIEFPCIIYQGSRGKALARAISDNRSSEWTKWSYPDLKDFIAEIDLGDFEIEVTGFSEDELKYMFDYEKENFNFNEELESIVGDGVTKKIYLILNFEHNEVLNQKVKKLLNLTPKAKVIEQNKIIEILEKYKL